MLTNQDKEWLAQKYPGLKEDHGVVSGTLEFTAAYNDKTNEFLIIEGGTSNTIGGTILNGRFEIIIKERIDKSFSELPALCVKNIDTIPDRHINQSDKTACLCNPLEEEEFLKPGFKFVDFFQRLVIPFLYGQEFFSLKNAWPWDEYAHGIVGILESYAKFYNSKKAGECIAKLKHDKTVWPYIKNALQRKSYIKGHTPCFCKEKDHIKRCHPIAWKGINLLKKDIEKEELIID